MPYSFKITRNTNDNRVRVQEITPAPRGAAPYRKRAPGYIESLQVYETRDEAKRARDAELLAADYSVLSPETLREILHKDLERVAFFGLSAFDAARVCQMSDNTLRAYAYGKSTPNPRKVARVHVFADLCESVANFVKDVLPDDAGCGNYMKARKGNPKLHTYSPSWRAARGISQSDT
jgi:hypothetical protein